MYEGHSNNRTGVLNPLVSPHERRESHQLICRLESIAFAKETHRGQGCAYTCGEANWTRPARRHAVKRTTSKPAKRHNGKHGLVPVRTGFLSSSSRRCRWVPRRSSSRAWKGPVKNTLVVVNLMISLAPSTVYTCAARCVRTGRLTLPRTASTLVFVWNFSSCFTSPSTRCGSVHALRLLLRLYLKGTVPSPWAAVKCDFVWLSARAASLAKSRKVPTRNLLPLF